MTTDHSKIRRLANGAIDTDHYIRQCHRQRSVAAHDAIRRFLAMLGALIEATRDGYRMALAVQEREATSGEPWLTDLKQSLSGRPVRPYGAAPASPSRGAETRRNRLRMGSFHGDGPQSVGKRASRASRQTLQSL
jgi:hypothetical protein